MSLDPHVCAKLSLNCSSSTNGEQQSTSTRYQWWTQRTHYHGPVVVVNCKLGSFCQFILPFPPFPPFPFFPPFPPYPSIEKGSCSRYVSFDVWYHVTLVEIWCEPHPFIQVTLKNPPNPSDIWALSGLPKHFADLCFQKLLPVIEGWRLFFVGCSVLL